MKFKFVASWGLLLALLLVTIELPVRAQDSSSNRQSSPLTLHLEIDKRTCPNARLKVIARLQNDGKEVVIIDKRSLWRLVHFKGFPEDLPYDAKAPFSAMLRLSRHLYATGDHFADDDVPSKFLVRINPRRITLIPLRFLSRRKRSFELQGNTL